MTELIKTSPRIAIPVPHSGDREYAERSLPQYEEAVRDAGGEPVRIELDQAPAQVIKQIEGCDAVLLPGSRADVDPGKYSADRHEKTAPADSKRNTVDELLLQDAYNGHKPVLAICYGLQSLNVYRSGTLVQHIESGINHSPGRTIANAHAVKIEPKSRLAEIVGGALSDQQTVAVNSSHHQSVDTIGEGLRVVARSAEDGIIEALEGTAPEHFVMAVQWHPERSVREGPEVAESAQAIFRAFIEAARAKRAELARAPDAIESKLMRVRGDFNGLFGDVLCLSHEDTCVDDEGKIVTLREGMTVTAFDEDRDEHGNPDDIIASGIVERPPEWLRCRGSRWILKIDENGVRHQSDLTSETRAASLPPTH
jgi:putative glutamine amidotransferase